MAFKMISDIAETMVKAEIGKFILRGITSAKGPARDIAERGYEEGREVAGEARERGRELSHRAYEEARHAAQVARERSRELSHRAYDRAKGAYDEMPPETARALTIGAGIAGACVLGYGLWRWRKRIERRRKQVPREELQRRWNEAEQILESLDLEEDFEAQESKPRKFAGTSRK